MLIRSGRLAARRRLPPPLVSQEIIGSASSIFKPYATEQVLGAGPVTAGCPTEKCPLAGCPIPKIEPFSPRRNHFRPRVVLAGEPKSDDITRRSTFSRNVQLFPETQ
jgi:hypothetical protein